MTSSTSVGRGRLRARRALLCLTTILASCGATAPALAQDQPYRQVDDNGIDLSTGDVIMAFKEASVGSGAAELAIIRRNGSDRDNSQFDGITFLRNGTGGGNSLVVGRGDRTYDAFDKNGSGQFVARKGNGATISGAGNDYTYTAPDGTAIRFTNPVGGTELCGFSGTQSNCTLLPVSITSPNGAVVTMSYDFSQYTPFDPSDPNPPAQAAWRLRQVANSYGYSFDYGYSSDTTYPDAPPPDAWYSRTGVTLRNSGSAVSSVGYAYPFSDVADVTDPTGNTWRVSSVSLRRPGETNNSYVVNSPSASFRSVTKDGVVTGYSRGVSGSDATMTVTNALSQSTTIVSDVATGRPKTITDPLSKTTTYSYDGFGRLTRITAPEGNYVNYVLDTRGNATETRAVGKPSSGVADIVTYAAYPATCSNAKTCNQPDSTTDARGGVTNYTYDPTHGGVTLVERPAPTPGAPRPTTSYSYTLIAGEYRLTGARTCTTAAVCTGSADEIVSSAGYDTAGNLTSSTTGSGNGVLSATMAMTYTAAGNVFSVDGPLAGTDDTTQYYHDAARRPIGMIGPDPDGAGIVKHSAERITYDSAGRITAKAVGYADTYGTVYTSNFTPLDEVVSTWDGDRKASDAGTNRGVVQYGYDSVGRLACSVQRMTYGALSSQPSDACTLGTPGSFGPDRLTRTYYDAASRVSYVQSAVGTADVSTDATATYSDNGQVQTLTDANGNRTTYDRDGFDRVKQTRYPVTTPGAFTSSTSDYEELGYDASSNVTSRRLRDGATIGYGYDALDRLTSKDLPGSEPDVTYAYDLTGRMTGASQLGHALSFSYDALGRQVIEGGPLGTITRTFDAAGRRTQMAWGDGNVVDYSRMIDGRLEYVRQNGATSGTGVLAWLRYDPPGLLRRIDRGNGTVMTNAFSTGLLQTSLAESFPGGTANVSWSFLGHTPAREQVSMTRSNDAYGFAFANANQPTSVNGLNQDVALGHDAKGNITAIGSSGYGYSSENLLTTAPGATLGYDPLGRLASIATGTGTTRFQYDGLDVVGEFDASGDRLRRYAHGDGVDQPMVWYEGSGLSDPRWLHADERGSIVAVSNASGTATINRYDEYGVPAGNTGRFGYTGQMWLSEIGLNYYKARMYAPQLGRFMQTDPIGYGDGMNLYRYVGGNPVNFTDPSGTDQGSGSCTNLYLNSGFFYPSTGQTSWTSSTRISLCAPNVDGDIDSSGGGGGAGSDIIVTAKLDAAKDIRRSIFRDARYGVTEWFYNSLVNKDSYRRFFKQVRCGIGTRGKSLQAFAAKGANKALALQAFSVFVPNPATEAAATVYGAVYGGLGLTGAAMEAVGGQATPAVVNLVMSKATNNRPVGSAFGSAGGQIMSIDLPVPSC